MPRGRKPKCESMPKIKEVRTNDTVQKMLKDTKKRGRKPSPSHVLDITDDLYIRADAHCWQVVKKNHTVNKSTGEYYPDVPILYYSELGQAIKGLMRYDIRIPSNIEELTKKIEAVEALIDKRIPVGIKPKDLFKDLAQEGQEEDN